MTDAIRAEYQIFDKNYITAGPIFANLVFMVFIVFSLCFK